MSSVTVTQEETPPVAPVDDGIPQRPEHVPEKFWDAEKGAVNTEALLKAQADTEAALTKQNQEGADDGANDNSGDDEVVSALAKAGLDANEFNTELETSGKLSEASYEKLAEAGYSKAMVDQYLAGQSNVQASQTLEAQEIKEVQDSVENFDDMVNWAKENLTPEELTAYNDMVNSGNKQQAKAAVAWVNSRYVDSEGSESNLLGGGENGTDFSVFRSTAEVTAAMKDARYGKDKAYTNDVARKVGRSNVF